MCSHFFFCVVCLSLRSGESHIDCFRTPVLLVLLSRGRGGAQAFEFRSLCWDPFGGLDPLSMLHSYIAILAMDNGRRTS